MPLTELPPDSRVCVIGAGSSGIATAKILNERGIDFDCFELSGRGAGRDSGASDLSFGELHLYLDGGVASGIEDLTGVDALYGAHLSLSLFGAGQL